MSVTKRTSKVVSYNEQGDDDDDFIPIVDKNRIKKSNDVPKETKLPKIVTKQSLRNDEKKLIDLSKSEEVKTKKEILEQSIIEIDDKENTDSQSSVSSNDSRTDNVNDQEEIFSPKNKRIKHDEEEDISENKEESLDKTEEIIQKTIDINTSGNNSTRLSDIPNRKSSLPLGFPTSKINIPSPYTSRVGLSRKSSTIKPLHPNINPHIHSE